MFDKKQKSCVKRIHLVTDNGLYDRKAFYTIKIVFYSSSVNDGEFINYCQSFIFNYKMFIGNIAAVRRIFDSQTTVRYPE